MIRILASLTLLCLFFPENSSAQVEGQFRFNGQNSEVLKIEKTVKVKRMIPREVPSTCTREVPYEINVCRDVARSRQECVKVPAGQTCEDVSEEVCKPVTRTREECTEGPSRRVCHYESSSQQCHERPTREVCRISPTGREVCNTVGGGEYCTTIPGGQVCEEEAGAETCRNVSYRDEDCTEVTRRRCTKVPAHNECRDVAYTENVCGMETQTRTEQYTCTRTELFPEETERKLTGSINVQILTNGLVSEFPIAFTLKEVDEKFEAFTLKAALKKEPKVLVVLKKAVVKTVSETKEEIVLDGQMIFEVLESKMLPLEFPSKIKSATLDKATKKLQVVFVGTIPGNGNFEFGLLDKKVPVLSFKDFYPSEKAALVQVGTRIAMDLSVGDITSSAKKFAMDLKLVSPVNYGGELLNGVKPKTEREFKGIKVLVK